MLLTRIDRRGGTVTIKIKNAQNQSITVTAVSLAVVPFGSGPSGTTTWVPYTYMGPLAVIIAGPDAVSIGAVPVPDGGGVLWGQVNLDGNPVAFPIEEMRLQ